MAKDCENCPHLKQRDKLAQEVIELKEQLENIKRQLEIRNRDIVYLEKKHEAGKLLASAVISAQIQMLEESKDKIKVKDIVTLAKKVVE